MDKFKSRFPFYNDDSDYTTNAPSYYDDLARKQKLLKLLSEKIWEYDEELAKRFSEWDKNLEKFDEEVIRLLIGWLEDGVLTQIINEEIFSLKVDKTDVNEIYVLAPKPNGVDDTENLQELFNKGYRNILFREGTYRVSIPNDQSRQALYWFTDEKNIQLIGRNTLIVDINNYTTPRMNNIFGFTRCENVTIKGITYRGQVVDDKENLLHVEGKTFAYFEDKSKNITIDLDIENARYGVRSGDYLEPSYGYCENFDLTIRSKNVGYPVALYLSEKVKAHVIADGFHRAVYLAGVFDANINAFVKNSYGATINVLLTNSITVMSDNQVSQVARGCKRIRLDVKDMGSKNYSPFTALTGIGLQWVARGTEFSDIKTHFHVRSSDNMASSVGGFHLDSAVASTPYTFEDYISFKNITISGIIDRSNQTQSSNQAGEIYIRGYDTTDNALEHAPVFENIRIEDVVIKKGRTQSRGLYIDVPKLTDILIINNLQAKDIDVFVSATDGEIIFKNSEVRNIAFTHVSNKLTIQNIKFVDVQMERVQKVVTSSISASLFSFSHQIRKINIPLDGSATYTIPNVFQSTGLVKGINGVFSSSPNTGSWKLGTVEEPDKFGTSPLSDSGYNRFSPYHYKQDSYPFYTNKPLVITFETTTPPLSGSIKLFIHEEEYMTK